MERFLYRLSISSYCKNFVLKGAFALLAMQAPIKRATRDLDFLGYTENSIANLEKIFQNVCGQAVEDDGIVFDSTNVKGEIIKEDAKYQGIRVKILGYLGKAEIPIQIDIGFADIVTPAPQEISFPVIIKNMPIPQISVYPIETIIAEKLQSMVYLGMINSRLKDYYDVWFLANFRSFDFDTLQKAVSQTFIHRQTTFPGETPIALSEEYANQKQSMWTALLRRNQIMDAPQSFFEVISYLNTFFCPLIYLSENPPKSWTASSGWIS